MSWCFPVPAQWVGSNGPLSYEVGGGGYSGNGAGQFTGAGNLPQAFVSLQNDRDRLTPYFWTLETDADGTQCICVGTNDAINAPLPESIKWEVDGETAVSNFEEIDKADDTDGKKGRADGLIKCLIGCTFSELFTLCLTKAAIIAGFNVPEPPTTTVTRFCSSAAGLMFVVDDTDGVAEQMNDGTGQLFPIPVDWNSWTDEERGQWIVDTHANDLELEGTAVYSSEPFSLIFSGGAERRLWRFARPALAVATEERDCTQSLECFADLFKCSFAELVTSMEIPLPVVISEDIAVTHAEGFVGGSDAALGYKYNATAANAGTGLYEIRFTTPHPREDYPVTFGPLSDGAARDGVHVEVINGTQNANGFDVWVGTGDNGAAADVLVDRTFSFRVGGTTKLVVTGLQ